MNNNSRYKAPNAKLESTEIRKAPSKRNAAISILLGFAVATVVYLFSIIAIAVGEAVIADFVNQLNPRFSARLDVQTVAFGVAAFVGSLASGKRSPERATMTGLATAAAMALAWFSLATIVSGEINHDDIIKVAITIPAALLSLFFIKKHHD